MVVSLSLAEGQAEVLTEGGVSGSGAAGGGVAGGTGCGTGDARKPRIVPIDCLQAVPDVPVKPGALPPGLAQRVLETLTLWCLDRSLNAAFSEMRNPNPPHVTTTTSASGSTGQQQSPQLDGSEKDTGSGQGMSSVLSPAVLDQKLLVATVRFQAAKAAQALLLHPPTASEFIKSASTLAPGRKAKGGAGAVLLEVASGVSSSSGMTELGAMEELVAMLLAQWQFLVLDGRSKKVEEARYACPNMIENVRLLKLVAVEDMSHEFSEVVYTSFFHHNRPTFPPKFYGTGIALGRRRMPRSKRCLRQPEQSHARRIT